MKEKKQRKRGKAKEDSFHRETKIAVINGPELWTRGAFSDNSDLIKT